VIGAVYLDAGWDAAEPLVLRMLAERIAMRPLSPTTTTTRAGSKS